MEIRVKKVYVEEKEDGTINNAIIIDGSELSDVAIEEILDICSQHKNLFLFGYPHHKEKRMIAAHAGLIYQKWQDSPRVCIAYTLKKLSDGDLAIELLFSNTSPRVRSQREIAQLLSLFQQNVLESIEALNT